MNIRNAMPNDSEQISRLLFQLHKRHHDNLPNDYKSPEEVAKKFDITGYFDNPQKIALVAEVDNKIIGVILGDIWQRNSLILKERKIAMIMDIMVADTYHNQGIGKQLYQTFEQQVKALGAEEIMVEIYAFNTTALNFYQSFGITPFIHVGVKKL